jgi:AbrB family looped-hinge helix DNA binding protein
MRVSDKGRVTIPKHIRTATGIAPSSEVSFSLGGRRIVIASVASHTEDDRRARLRAASAQVRNSLNLQCKQFAADDIMNFLLG